MSLAPLDTAEAALLWKRYATAFPEAARTAPDYTTERFGDSARLADELLGLVLDGTKRATASLLRDSDPVENPLPRIGSHWIVCDSTGTPRAVLRTTELRIGPFHSVDDAFAHDEGEDDRTRDSWLTEHRRYFERRCAALNTPWSEELEVLFERFTVAFPPPSA
ncbi:ASCH domain-containing protein [Actinoplanes sp. NPDC051861]|uniref:ASCH domain-containing protein n=1 Tax=Actinoplanes sp. NPDC051861 TaxID=3155170 RepID=UPI003447DFF7